MLQQIRSSGHSAGPGNRKTGGGNPCGHDSLGEFKDGEFILDEDKLHEVIAGYKVGSILNAPGPVAQSLEKWQEIIGRIQEVSMKEIGIPCIYGLDQVHGTTYWAALCSLRT